MSINAWDRRTEEKEPMLWYSRFLIFRDLGPDRSLLGAVKKANKSPKKPITDIPGAWREAAKSWDWKARAEAYDAHLLAEKEERARILREIEAAEIERILTTDYATIHRRVEALAHWAHVVEDSFRDENGNVNFKFLSPDKLREWRGMLDDIAKETGGRVKKSELAGKDGGAIIIETQWGSSIIEKAEDKE